MTTRVKICGLTRGQDARDAAQLGADAIGLVFYPPSPRCVTVAQAQSIVAQLPPFVTVVALFVNAKDSEVREVLANVRVDYIQFHGEEKEADCLKFAKPYIKAIAARSAAQVSQDAAAYPTACGILLDRFDREKFGGTGEGFDWDLIPDNIAKPLILAGGLDASNVAAAIQKIKPYAVDVSSGVESKAGVKDRQKMRAFIQAVHEQR